MGCDSVLGIGCDHCRQKCSVYGPNTTAKCDRRYDEGGRCICTFPCPADKIHM